MTTKMNTMHSEIPAFNLEERRKYIILKLCNFRTYSDVEVKIPFNSVTLINGPSGVGKTTLLEAFMFILYSGFNNPEKFETKRCWGWLFLGDYIIYRQKDPSLLKVWKASISPGSPMQAPQEYSQDEAQSIIDSIYGNKECFLGCSYLRQKEFSVFLSGTDSEKLELMKTIAMKGSELDELKGPIKHKVSQLKEVCTATRAQFELALGNIQLFDQKNPNLGRYQIPESSDEIMTKVREVRSMMEDLDKHFEGAAQREAGINLSKQQADNFRSRKAFYEKQIVIIDVVKTRERLIQVEEKLKEYSGVSFDAAKLAKAQLFKVWTQEMDRLGARLAEIDKEYEMNTANIRKNLIEYPAFTPLGSEFSISPERTVFQTNALQCIEKWKGKFEIAQKGTSEATLLLSQVQVTTIQDAKTTLKNVEEELTKAKEKETTIKADLEKKRQANKMKCPTCSSVLIVADDGKHLEKCGDAPQGIGAMVAPVEPSKPVIPITVSHDDLVAAISQTASLTHRKDRLVAIITAVEEKLKFDLGSIELKTALILLPLFTKNQELKLALDSLHDSRKEKNAHRPEEITEKIADTQDKNMLETEQANLKKTIDGYEQLSKLLEQEDSAIRQFVQMGDEIIKAGGPSTSDIRKRKSELQNNLDQLMHLSSATDMLAQRNILEKLMQEKRVSAEQADRRYNDAVRLYERAVEAERISLETAVAEINSHLSQILKRLFNTVPISVALSTTKNLKSKKDAVSQRFDIKIFYNNAEYGSSKQLSGGEKDRLSLAITLAMSQKFGGSILFLDETLSSLDAELKAEAITLLKELSPNRTVVCISHEETEGLYNHVIRIPANN